MIMKQELWMLSAWGQSAHGGACLGVELGILAG